MQKNRDVDNQHVGAWQILSRDDLGITWLVILLLAPAAGFLLVRVIGGGLVDVVGRTTLVIGASVAAVSATLCALGALWFRVIRVKRLIRDGLRLQARVLDTTQYGRGFVLAKVEYFVGSERYTAVSPPLSATGLVRGEMLEIVLDREKPTNPLFLRLFLRTSKV